LKIAFTPTIAYNLIKRAKSNFRKCPYAPQVWKDTFDKLHLFVAIAEKIPGYPNCWAMSWMLNDTHGKTYGIDPLIPKTKVGNKEWWLCLEFQIQTVCEADGPSVFNLITHEAAHSLDYGLRGKMQETNEEAHDEFFRVLMTMMGGTENYRFPHKSGVQGRVNKSIDAFYGTSVVAP
jgi:hypothetical protein